ncbi:hypothetical protein FGIG_12297 [Fasciola gigantica]|uniref:Uncharacterized protein n=1 Tax=Fasciola gigantica TaxID=46835 RepID=A0A504YMZ9_FASGI|nr:hypothetical protein FGIG_12297 [Fasciola gigantica]
MNSKSPRRIGLKTRGRSSLEKSKSKSFLKPSRNLTPEPKQQNFCAVIDRRHIIGDITRGNKFTEVGEE